MSRRSSFLAAPVADYLLDSLGEEPELLGQLRRETAPLEGAGMQIGPDQGRFLTLLVELLAARKAIEIGVYTGYSSICIASALHPAGKLIACDLSDEWTRVARRYWQLAQLSERVDLRLGEASATLDDLLATGEANTFDFTFIDADKANLDLYYERCLTLLRPGGLIVVDNALWEGRVVDENDQSTDTAAIRALNHKANRDPRVTASLIAVGDGLLLARKRA